MSPKPFAVAAVALAAASIVGVKMMRQRPVEAAVSERAASPSVVLIADPREADTECGCGQIIRRVREAKRRGVEVQELAPTDPAVSRYGVAVSPTVLLLGADGRVLTRREGESSETVAAITTDLAALERQRR
ncbi:hypothetical protein [Anaeromyxobacter oryzae]|uniref:Thioredoxin domain-containing protein n=1 Tax=Anaeromyxobacter oryzae TaxID=2918170 RepID=A0ABM7X423_9BACT|nr:hypothetical protein [Anaeromyxobacter oryzae]BDG06529.1 hypothetical protein AMOR_55250 [Anaeromyxobacter oryzae]